MTAASADGSVRERRVAIAREGSDPDTWVGLAKINVSTGEIQYIHTAARAEQRRRRWRRPVI